MRNDIAGGLSFGGAVLIKSCPSAPKGELNYEGEQIKETMAVLLKRILNYQTLKAPLGVGAL